MAQIPENVTRMRFVENGSMWQLALTYIDGSEGPGEPFQGTGRSGFTKLEWVVFRIREIGYRAMNEADQKPNESSYTLDVERVNGRSRPPEV